MSLHLKLVLALTLVFTLGVLIGYVQFTTATENTFHHIHVENVPNFKHTDG